MRGQSPCMINITIADCEPCGLLQSVDVKAESPLANIFQQTSIVAKLAMLTIC